jgi:DNA-binding CsgD family transcriptional regulator
MRTDTGPDGGLGSAAVRQFATACGDMIRAIDQPGFLAALQASLGTLAQFDNYIVYEFEENCAARLVHTNLDPARLTTDMGPYQRGLYLLDPFYLHAVASHQGSFRSLSEIAPEGFLESEFYQSYYRTTGVADEARYMIRIGRDHHVHVFAEREPPHERFSPADLARLSAILPIVQSAVERHWNWRRMGDSVRSGERARLGFGVRNVISGLGGSVLTPREVDIVELSIKGHSSKSIAAVLDISEGTVINHKRNVYAKLDIGSQSQLFHLFLQALFSNDGEPAPAHRERA